MHDTQEKIKPKMDLAEPPLYAVRYQNDDVTTVEFVVASLVEIFNHTESDAHALATKINDEGSAIVAVLPHEIAEQKGVEVTVAARNSGYPLLVRLEQA
jgi:ATP-dependent Clp protease adaptor protein ClpS